MMRLLLIEDDAWIAESYARILSTQYDVAIVAGGQAALDYVDGHDTDVIIADVMLDGGIIIDVLHDLKSYTDTKSIPIILCSSLSSHIALADVAGYGVVALLDKGTLTPNVLLQAVQKAAAEAVTHG